MTYPVKVLSLAVFIATLSSATVPATAQEAPRLQQMAGTWDVSERMWPGPGQTAVQLPKAVADRTVIGRTFLQETMTSVHGTAQPFTRIAHFNYNPVTHRYEYFSIDTRAPQMMNERSSAAAGVADGDELSLAGGSFVAARWGSMVNAPFTYRLVLGSVEGGRQLARLYLTPLSGPKRTEFLAFEYVYAKRK